MTQLKRDQSSYHMAQRRCKRQTSPGKHAPQSMSPVKCDWLPRRDTGFKPRQCHHQVLQWTWGSSHSHSGRQWLPLSNYTLEVKANSYSPGCFPRHLHAGHGSTPDVLRVTDGVWPIMDHLVLVRNGPPSHEEMQMDPAGTGVSEGSLTPCASTSTAVWREAVSGWLSGLSGEHLGVGWYLCVLQCWTQLMVNVSRPTECTTAGRKSCVNGRLWIAVTQALPQ